MRMKKLLLLPSLFGFLTSCSCGGAGGGKNSDKSFAMIGTWTPSGIVNHYDTNTYCDVLSYFVVEGLYRYVRSTDEIYCQIAEGMPVHSTEDINNYAEAIGQDALEYYLSEGCNEVEVMTVKINPLAKWHNGDSVIAKDIWAYYYIMHPTSTNYLAAVNIKDDLTLEFVWNPLKKVSNSVKELLIAQDTNGTVKYDEFANYVDPIYEIVMASPVNKNPNLWGAFNRFSTDEQILELNKAKSEFFSYSPSWYVGTGPFKFDTFSATQLLLVKNEDYWAADKVGFDKVKIYSSTDLNQTYNLLTNGYIHYLDGFIQQDTLESILASNPDLVNLKMYDPGAFGLTFNLESSYFQDNKVREAFQYIFDRDEIKEAGNPYGKTSWYPLMGMAESEASTYMSEEHFNDLPKFSQDQDKAAQLLTEAGWTKNSDGQWCVNGEPVSLNLGAPSTQGIASTSAEATAAQLNAFGIQTNLLISSNFYGNATVENSQYDIMLEWTDLNMSFSYPTGSYLQFRDVYSQWIHVPEYPEDYADNQKAGQIKLVFNGLDGDTNTYEFADYINTFYSLPEEELTYLVDVFNLGLAEMNLGVQFFQNVTSSTLNTGMIKGVPLEEYWSENRNVEYVPQAGTEDFYTVAKTNLVYARNNVFITGMYQPNTSE